MAMGELVYRISSQGSDPRRLGRWSNMTVTGKNELHTTIITCYCPAKGTCTGSAYVQHLKYMADHRNELPEDMDCPRQLLGHDLKQYIDSLQTCCHQIIVMGDFNSEYSELEEWMMDLGLTNRLKAKYGSPIIRWNTIWIWISIAICIPIGIIVHTTTVNATAFHRSIWWTTGADGNDIYKVGTSTPDT